MSRSSDWHVVVSPLCPTRLRLLGGSAQRRRRQSPLRPDRPLPAPLTTETRIGECRARQVSTRAVIEVATRLIEAYPVALLCDDATCRCGVPAAPRVRYCMVRFSFSRW